MSRRHIDGYGRKRGLYPGVRILATPDEAGVLDGGDVVYGSWGRYWALGTSGVSGWMVVYGGEPATRHQVLRTDSARITQPSD